MIDSIGKKLLIDTSNILGRPLFTTEEIEVLSSMFDEAIETNLKKNIEIYVKHNQNLVDLIDFQSLGGDYYNLQNGI